MVKPLIEDMKIKYPDLDIRMLEIYHNTTNQQMFGRMSRQFGISSSGVPTVFIGTTAMVGDADIKNRFETTILAERERIASCTSTTTETVTPPDPTCSPEALQLTIPVVVASALVDSINPCAFSVLIFLLISIVAIENRRRILMVGGVYIAAVFMFYLLIRVRAIYSRLSVRLLPRALAHRCNGCSSARCDISSGRYEKPDEFLLAIPPSKKEQIERYIRTATLPAAFALGIFVGIFELPCTGGIYLAILGLMSRSYTLMEGLPYLILYNFIFVLPLILDPAIGCLWSLS